MTDIEFKGGRKPPRLEEEAPRINLGLHLLEYATPPHIDYLSAVTSWPMYLNDQIGDCTCAAAGHMREAWTAIAQTSLIEVTDDNVLTLYEQASGYIPGEPATDKGAVMQDVLSLWRKNGLGGGKILVYAKVDHTNLAEVVTALNEFGTVYLGINFPETAMTQFNRGVPWDVVKGAKIEGGHAINAGYYDAPTQMWKVVTWGKVQPMTQAFFDTYVEEAWAVISPDWLNAMGVDPESVNLYGLGEEFSQLTGQPNPFPQYPSEVNQGGWFSKIWDDLKKDAHDIEDFLES